MIPKHFYTIALAAMLSCEPVCSAPAPARGTGADEAVLAAQAAFRAGDAVRLARHAAALEGHVLLPYAEYWQLKLRLEEMPSTEVRAYMARAAKLKSDRQTTGSAACQR